MMPEALLIVMNDQERVLRMIVSAGSRVQDGFNVNAIGPRLLQMMKTS